MATLPNPSPSATDALPVLPMPLSQFPNLQVYAECQEMAGVLALGSHALETSTYYYAVRLGKAYPLWKSYLGDCYFHAVMAALTPDLERCMASIEAPKSRGAHRAVPDIVLLVAHALSVALQQQTGELLRLLDDALDEYLGLDEELVPHLAEITLLLQPFVQLIKGTKQDAPYKAHQLRTWRKLCWQIVTEYGVPVKLIHELISDPEAPIVIPSTLPTPNLIQHLDGSVGIDASPIMPEWFAPRRPIVPTSGEQINDTLKLHPKPYADALALWWRLHNDGRYPETYLHTAARVLDAVGRTLQALFKHHQMATLNTIVPTDILVGGIVDFVVAYNANPPSLSIAQLRVSFLSAAIAAITVTDSLSETIQSVCEKAGLQDIEKLLRLTMEMHEDRLTQAYPPLKSFRTKH